MLGLAEGVAAADVLVVETVARVATAEVAVVGPPPASAAAPTDEALSPGASAQQ